MVVAVGAIVLITAVAVAGYFMSQQSLNESRRVSGENRAFQAASAGLDSELARFDPARITQGQYPTQPQTLPDGSSYVVDVVPLSGFEYKITSTGSSGGLQEQVSQRFFFLNLWDMSMGAGKSASIGGGNGWNGNATIDGPFYCRGDFEWTATALYSRGPLFVKDGAIVITGSGELGTEAEPIKVYATKGVPQNLDQIHPDGMIGSSVPDIDLPWVDTTYLDAMLERAKDESMDNKMGDPVETPPDNLEADVLGDPSYPTTAVAAPGATVWYKFIGSGTAYTKPIATPQPNHGASTNGGSTNIVLDGTTPFGRWDDGVGGLGYDAGLSDDFAYQLNYGVDGNGVVYDRLYIHGTVFIDGDLTVRRPVRYVGKGTIIVNGDINIENDPGGSPEYLLPEGDVVNSTHSLGLVSPGRIDLHDANYHGALFVNGEFGVWGTATEFTGTALSGVIYGDSPNVHITMDPNLSDNLPGSMPGAGGGLVFPGTWTRR